jgi:hypothetical protein
MIVMGSDRKVTLCYCNGKLERLSKKRNYGTADKEKEDKKNEEKC